MTKTLRNNRAYTARRDALKRATHKQNTPCHLCNKPIDTTLNWKHPMSFTADHLQPIANGGKMLGPLKPAHRACNSRRGTKPLHTHTPPTPPRTSRQW